MQNATIQQRQTPLSTYRVHLRWPLSRREKDLRKRMSFSPVALSPANWVGGLWRVSNLEAGQPIVMHLVERVQCCPVGDQSAGKVKAFLTGEACLRREGCVRDTHRLPEWVFFRREV